MTDRDQPADDGTDLSSGSGASVGPALRSRAEESLRRQSSLRVARAEAVLPESAQRTLHELRVSQIELEMQNEELRNAQVALEAARARNVELYDLAPVGYCTVSRQGLILEANLSAATLLGIDRTTLIGQPLSRYIAGDDADHFHLQRRQILDTGEPLAGELRMTTAAGTPFWAQLAARAAPAADGTPALYVVLSDVTARKQAELELARHRDHLEDLVQERTAALAVARDLAEAASRAKTTFLSTMSHELRMPMTGVMGMLELAVRRTTDSKTREYLGKVGDCVLAVGRNRPSRGVEHGRAVDVQFLQPDREQLHDLARVVFVGLVPRACLAVAEVAEVLAHRDVVGHVLQQRCVAVEGGVGQHVPVGAGLLRTVVVDQSGMLRRDDEDLRQREGHALAQLVRRDHEAVQVAVHAPVVVPAHVLQSQLDAKELGAVEPIKGCSL